MTRHFLTVSDVMTKDVPQLGLRVVYDGYRAV